MDRDLPPELRAALDERLAAAPALGPLQIEMLAGLVASLPLGEAPQAA